MENQKSKVSLEEQLLRAREENLKNVHSWGGLRAHGKVLGMNAFSWKNPDMEAFVATVSAMPFNWIWIASKKQAMEISQEYPEMAGRFKTVLIYDPASECNAIHAVAKFETVVCVENLQYALSMLRSVREAEFSLLFTTDGPDWEVKMEQFETYINAIG